MSDLPNKSKMLNKADDSAAKLLMELLSGSHGRNFDIESLFVERLDDGSWKFTIYEFLKGLKVKPEHSHPNYYWNQNKRKFLSLWALTKVFRKAGFDAELLLVNYDDDRTNVKVMKVLDVTENPSKVFRETRRLPDGRVLDRVMSWIETDDEVMPFAEFKARFKKFNDTKLGDTWELLGELEAY